MTTTIEYALMAGASYVSNRDKINRFPIPSEYGWGEVVGSYRNLSDTSGFEAVSFVKGSEIVISYAGTGSGWGDWIHGNTPLALGALSDQLRQAADYYLQIKNDPANAGKTITLTGHSLGGGLASLIAVMFNETAVTFDQAPFRNAALTTSTIDFSSGQPVTITHSVAKDLLTYLSGETTNGQPTYSALQLQGLTNFISASQANSGIVPNQSNVTDINTQGEVLSGLPLARIGSQTNLMNGQSGVSSTDLHSVALLTAMLQSGDTATSNSTNHTLGQVTFKLKDLLKMIFDKNLFASEVATNTPNFLERIVKHQAGGTVVNGSETITADDMVLRFTRDLWKLAQDGGVTMADGNATDAAQNFVSKALTAFAMQFYYEDTANAKNKNKELFTDLNTAGSGSNGINFDIADVSKEIKAAIDSNGRIKLSNAKGYQEYFLKYINDVANFSIEEQKLIQSALPTLRDWYVQAGTGGMSATDTNNRGAFMLGGSGSDTMTGGTANDFLIGNAGDDSLTGGGGNDILYGGFGSDTLDGGTGNDSLSGGTGYDLYKFSGSFGTDVVNDLDGQGGIQVDGQTLSDGKQIGDNRTFQSADKQHTYVYLTGNSVDGGDLLIDGHILVKNHKVGDAGDLDIHYTAPTDNSIVVPSISNTSREIIGDKKTKIFEVDLPWPQTPTSSALSNTIQGITQSAFGEIYNINAIWTTPPYLQHSLSSPTGVLVHYSWAEYDDIGNLVTDGDAPNQGDGLYGSDGNDHIVSGGGNDGVVGNAGNDFIELGEGDDSASGNDGNDYIDGGTGKDIILGGAGKDILIGGNGSDILQGGNDDDWLFAGQTSISLDHYRFEHCH